MDHGFEDRVLTFSRAFGLLDGMTDVLVAASGGADSTALLHTLHRLRARGLLHCRLVCAHVNHRLRGPEGDADERFVRSQAETLGIPWVGVQVDVVGFAGRHRLSLETAARVLRTQALEAMAGQSRCQGVVTGHQKNDNAETVIQRLERGTGFRGVAGIWPSRPIRGGLRVVRPLLCATRQEVLQYLRGHHLQWREDATNASLRFRRNAIRARLMPALEAESSAPLVGLLSDLALATYRLYRDVVLPQAALTWPAVASRATPTGVELEAGLLRDQAPLAQVELIRQALGWIGCGERDLTERHYAGILALAASKGRAGAVSLPGGFMALARADRIHIGLPAPRPVPDPGQASLKIPGQVRWGPWLVDAAIFTADALDPGRITDNPCPSTAWLDCDRLSPPLVVRARRPGDRIRPLGQDQDKKVGRLLTDARIPPETRGDVLVVEDGERIVWVCPVRMSDQVKVTRTTRQVVRLTVRRVQDPA